MADAEIHYKLNLILRLVDTTTGRKVKERQVIFKADNRIITFQQKDEGVYILMNHAGEDMTLDISAKGYLPMQTKICFEKLSARLPEVEVPLIPETGRNRFVDYLTLEGKKPGLTSVEAVSPENPHGMLISYQPRRQSLKLYYAKAFEEQSYAVVHEEAQQFEEFRVEKKLNKLEIKLASPLVTKCEPKEKISRIVRGKVEPDGSYLLRILEDGSGAGYLVRYVVDGKESFEWVSSEKRKTETGAEAERS